MATGKTTRAAGSVTTASRISSPFGGMPPSCLFRSTLIATTIRVYPLGSYSARSDASAMEDHLRLARLMVILIAASSAGCYRPLPARMRKANSSHARPPQPCPLADAAVPRGRSSIAARLVPSPLDADPSMGWYERQLGRTDEATAFRKDFCSFGTKNNGSCERCRA